MIRFALLILLLSPSLALAKAAIIGATALTGGGTGALDAVECEDILGDDSARAVATGDFAIVATSAPEWYVYRFNASGTDAESSPTIIVPDDRAADCSGNGQWELAPNDTAMIPDLTAATITHDTATSVVATWDGSGELAAGSVDLTELSQLETIGATTLSAAQWVGLGGATAAGIALWDDANAAAQLVTLGLTATASEINTPLDGASVTLTEFQELETIGATTISAAQWAGLGGATTAGIALWDDATAAAQRTTLGAPQRVAAGTSVLGTSAIASGACATVVTTSATGTATTDVVNWGFNSDPTSTTGYTATANGMLTIITYPSTNNVNFKVCNNTASSITPGARTLNWVVVR